MSVDTHFHLLLLKLHIIVLPERFLKELELFTFSRDSRSILTRLSCLSRNGCFDVLRDVKAFGPRLKKALIESVRTVV